MLVLQNDRSEPTMVQPATDQSIAYDRKRFYPGELLRNPILRDQVIEWLSYTDPKTEGDNT